MSKITQKSINTLVKNYRNSLENITITIPDLENEDKPLMEITVKRSLTVEEKGMFIDRVTNACFDIDGEYLPEYFNPVFQITLLQMTTNVPIFISEDELVDSEESKIIDIQRTYELCNSIDLRHTVSSRAFQRLYDELYLLSKDKIAFRREMQINGAKQKLAKAQEELEASIEMFSAVATKLNETLSEISGLEDMSEALKNVDYSKLIDTFMDKMRA